MTVDSGAVCVATSHFLHWEPLGRHPTPPPSRLSPTMFLCSSADVHIRKHTYTRWMGGSGGGAVFLRLKLCVYMCCSPLYPLLSPRAVPHGWRKGVGWRGVGGLHIHWNGGWDSSGEEVGWVLGGCKSDWVCCLAKKKRGGAERRGEKPPPPSCLKNWRGKGGRRRRGADRQDRRFRGGGEGRTGGWLAPWLACVCGERGWAINSSCSSNSLRRFDVHNCLFAPGADPMSWQLNAVTLSSHRCSSGQNWEDKSGSELMCAEYSVKQWLSQMLA